MKTVLLFLLWRPILVLLSIGLPYLIHRCRQEDRKDYIQKCIREGVEPQITEIDKIMNTYFPLWQAFIIGFIVGWGWLPIVFIGSIIFLLLSVTDEFRIWVEKGLFEHEYMGGKYDLRIGFRNLNKHIRIYLGDFKECVDGAILRNRIKMLQKEKIQLDPSSVPDTALSRMPGNEEVNNKSISITRNEE